MEFWGLDVRVWGLTAAAAVWVDILECGLGRFLRFADVDQFCIMELCVAVPIECSIFYSVYTGFG